MTVIDTSSNIILPPFRKHKQGHHQQSLVATTIQAQFGDDHLVTQPSSCVELKQTEAVTLQTQQQNKKKRARRFLQVRFADESCNRVYENKVLHAQECKALWYTAADLCAFRQAYTDLLVTLRHLDMEAVRNPEAWAGSLRRAHAAFCTFQAATPLLQALQQIPRDVFLLSALGTERAAFQSVVMDTTARRKEMYALITVNSAMDERVLAAVCRSLSRPCRLYARHVAEMAASKTVFKADLI